MSGNVIAKAQITNNRGHLTVTIPSIKTNYLNLIMRSDCFLPINDLFKKAHAPAKEITESYSAFQKLRKWIKKGGYKVIHVGDGAHSRTAALFAFYTKLDNLAVDPKAMDNVCGAWKEKWKVERFDWRVSSIENALEEINLDPTPKLITFVHSHTDTDFVLDRIKNWDAAFTLSCCQEKKQFTHKYKILEEGADWNVLSDKRKYEVIVNERKEG